MPIAQPKIAILLAAYNGMAWIEEQLASIQAQIDVSVTLFISIDPSVDGTETWCASYAAAHPNTVILAPTGRFGGAARNFFRLLRDVDFSMYEYVAFSDQDDIWNHDKLSRAVGVLASGVYDGYSSNVTAFWPDGRRMLINKAQPQVKWDHLFEAAGPGSTYVMTKQLVTDFKNSLIANWLMAQDVSLHDWYCYAFARSSGYEWFIDPVPGLDYRQHANNQLGVNAGIRSGASRLKKVFNGWWFDQIRLISSLTEADAPWWNESYALKTRSSMIELAWYSPQCRRRKAEKILLGAICLLHGLSIIRLR